MADLTAGSDLSRAIPAGRHAWLQVLRGSVRVNDLLLQTSDAIAASDESSLAFRTDTQAELMLFDLA